MPLANYSTTSQVADSIGPIMAMLARAGAKQISTEYEDRKLVGMTFYLDTEYGPRDFRLPVRVEGMHRVLSADATLGPRYKTPEHAARVAWRTAHDWLRAQLALVEAEMVTFGEVMLPYALVAPDKTAYEQYVDTRKAIES